jgi:protein involved in polysaccharide export with SLBB domain
MNTVSELHMMSLVCRLAGLASMSSRLLLAGLCATSLSAAAQQTSVPSSGLREASVQVGKAAGLPAPAAASTSAMAVPRDSQMPAQPRSDGPVAGARPFGHQIFRGQFAAQSFTGFNPDYQLSPGDRVVLRLWGAFSLDTTQVVDAQGNVFLPNIGPVRVQGVRNAELNDLVQQQVKRVFRANVQSYANLEAAQPVKIYVTGFVRQPGLYSGLSSDSVLHYLDAAGGIDPERGSFLNVQVLRNNQLRAGVDLYRFLLEGRIDALQLHDGDTILVAPRRHAVLVSGDVANEAMFEMLKPETTADQLLALARPKASATHLSVVRWRGAERSGEYHALSDAAQVRIGDGDELTVTSDKIPGTLLIRIDGAHRGQRTAVLPYGARLKDALALVQPAPQARMSELQLYRKSVAARQKDMLAVALDKLETQVLTARSATNEEATLRTREAELVMQFTKRARTLEPKGQLVMPRLAAADDLLLEDGDTLVIPERSSQVAIHGEVMFPMAVHHDDSRTAGEYIELAGGYTQNADTSRVLLMRRSGAVQEANRSTRLQPGEELMVLPKADTKNIEVTRGITQIIYQIAIAAKVALGL